MAIELVEAVGAGGDAPSASLVGTPTAGDLMVVVVLNDSSAKAPAIDAAGYTEAENLAVSASGRYGVFTRVFVDGDATTIQSTGGTTRGGIAIFVLRNATGVVGAELAAEAGVEWPAISFSGPAFVIRASRLLVSGTAIGEPAGTTEVFDSDVFGRRFAAAYDDDVQTGGAPSRTGTPSDSGEFLTVAVLGVPDAPEVVPLGAGTRVARDPRSAPEPWAKTRDGLTAVLAGTPPTLPSTGYPHLFRSHVSSDPREATRAWAKRLTVLHLYTPPLPSLPWLKNRVVTRPPPGPAPWVFRETLHLINFGRRTAELRGLHRVFNAVAFRVYRSNSAPPSPGSTPWATSSTLPTTPAGTFADGTWYVALSYFNGVIDSGFLPVGPAGEPYRVLEVSSGAGLADRPAAPLLARLEVRPGGVVRVVAVAVLAGSSIDPDTWAIAYTFDGSEPATDTPDATEAMSTTTGLKVLSLDLAAQANGATVKVRVQVRRAGVYSLSEVLTATTDATGPAAPDAGEAWPAASEEAQ